MGKEKFEKFTLNDWKVYIHEALANDKSALTRALMIVYNNQTDAEKRSKAGLDHNGVGFDKNDVKLLSEAAELIENGIDVPPELWSCVEERVPRYWRQIMEHSKRNLEKQKEVEKRNANALVEGPKEGLGGHANDMFGAKEESECTVELIRHPTDVDWARCKVLALNTIGKDPKNDMITAEWRRKILTAEHSPIRTLMFTIRMEVPYYVSVHFARHKYGVEHYVQSQRNDRQSDYDRNEAPQNHIVTHIMDINAQELMHMSHLRLCSQADARTRFMMTLICSKVEQKCPEFKGLLVPSCGYLGRCPEFSPCKAQGKYHTNAYSEKDQTAS